MGTFDVAYFDPDAFDTDDAGGLTGLIPRHASASIGIPSRPAAALSVPGRPTATIVVPAHPSATVEA